MVYMFLSDGNASRINWENWPITAMNKSDPCFNVIIEMPKPNGIENYEREINKFNLTETPIDDSETINLNVISTITMRDRSLLI
jgi:hypothetical protein